MTAVQQLPADVEEFVSSSTTCAVATTRSDGTIRHSITYFLLDQERIVVSTLATRGKARDIERSGKASVCVFGHAAPFPSVTIEGSARVVTDPAEVGRVTRALGRRTLGDKAPSPSDEQIVAAGRVVLEITPERCYGASYLPTP